MNRALPLLLVLSLLLPTAAFAAFRSGRYAGKTSRGKPVSFRATQATLSRLRIDVTFTCTDGDSFGTVLAAFPRQNIVKTRAGTGRYSATFTGARGASRYVNKGSIRNRLARGTFTGRRLYNAENDLDPRGTIVCTTGTLRYAARRP